MLLMMIIYVCVHDNICMCSYVFICVLVTFIGFMTSSMLIVFVYSPSIPTRLYVCSIIIDIHYTSC